MNSKWNDRSRATCCMHGMRDDVDDVILMMQQRCRWPLHDSSKLQQAAV